jgi:hypothetical protein
MKRLSVDYATSLPNCSSEQDEPNEGRAWLLLEPGFCREFGKLFPLETYVNTQLGADTREPLLHVKHLLNICVRLRSHNMPNNTLSYSVIRVV